MDIVNNRYRIVNRLKQSRLYSIYEALDIQKGFITVKLYILNSKYVSKDFIDYCTLKFENLGSLNNNHMIEAIEFGTVKQIDNKKSYQKTYYYTTEYVNDKEKVLNINYELSEKHLVKCFVNICKAVKYFDNSGGPYSELNIDNIYIKDKDFIIKLKDTITTELEKNEFNSELEFVNLFKSPESISNGIISISSQIYSLGIILLILSLKSNGLYESKRQVAEVVNDIQNCGCNAEGEILSSKIYAIILKMISLNSENRYSTIDMIIEDINNRYGTSYRAHSKSEMEKLNFDIRIIGREEEISSILSVKESVFKYNLTKNVVAVHGEMGIGKTRLLRHINYISALGDDYAIFSFNNGKVNDDYSNKSLVDILRQIIPMANSELKNKYAFEIGKFVPELSERKNLLANNPLKGNKEKYRLISRLASFLEEFFSDKQGVIIIDDLDKADEFTLDFFFYLMSKYNKGTKIMILFSYCDGECLENKKFMEFLSNVRDSVRLELLLKPLTTDQAGFMIKEILNIAVPFVKFTENIYRHTRGNPLFIEETMKDIFLRKMIYVEENSGKWYKLDDDKFFLPQNMYEAYRNQMGKIDKISLEVLSIISIFESAISMEVIREFINEHDTDISIKIDDLISKGLLCRKIEDRGFVYDFYNRFLKAFIYESIDKEEKREKHRLASGILSKYYEENDNNLINEMIYHLEKSDQYNKLLYYYLENAEIMITLKNRAEGIKNLSKAIQLVEERFLDQEGSTLNNKLNLLIKIGDLYSEEGGRAEALCYYTEAEEIAEKSELIKEQIDIIFKIIDIIFLTGEEILVDEYLVKVKRLLSAIEYTEGKLNYLKIICQKAFNEQRYEESYNTCTEGIKLCGDKYIKHKVIFNTYYSNVLIVRSKIQEALKNLNQCLKQCYETNYHTGIVKIMNSLGVIYSDYLQDNEEALKCFEKVYKLSKEHNDIYDEIIALSNIGFTNFTLQNYDYAYEYFIKAVNKAKKYDYNSMIFYGYTYLGNISFKFGNYGEAHRYYSLCEDQLRNGQNQGQEVGPFYLLAFRLNFIFGNKEKASEYIEKAAKIYESSDSILKWELEVLRLFANLMINKSFTGNIIKELLEISEKITGMDSKLAILYECIIILRDLGFIIEAKKIYEFMENNNMESKNNRLICNKLYLQNILSSNINIEELMKATDICNKHEQTHILWRIYSEIGNYYFRKKEYSYAVTYYFEACGIIADLVLQVPKEYRVTFINSNNMIKPFMRFIDIENYFENNKLFSKAVNSRIYVNNESDIEILFNYLNDNKILKNKKFMRTLKKIWALSIGEDIQEFGELIDKLSLNSIKNMELIIQYMSYTTLATKASVIIEVDKKFQVLASSGKDNELPKDLSIVERCRDSLKPILSKDNFLEGLNLNSCKISSNNVRAAMCIPIVMDSKLDLIDKYKRDSDIYYYNDNVLGYVYIESERILNNINDNTIDECTVLSKILGVVIDKHNTTISSSIDKLTGTFTRKQLERLIQNQIDRACELNTQFSLLMFDLDKFKDINDNFGHRAGDKVLQKLCEIVMNNIRQRDLVGRYGGEEFIVILPDTDVEGAKQVAEKIRGKIEQGKILGDKRDVTISLGISNYPHHSVNYEELVEKADQALYAAKNNGRNIYKVWNETYSLKGNTTNRLSGILTGSTNQDFRNVSTLVEIVDLINENKTIENKIYSILGKIIEVTESENAGLFLLEDNNIVNTFVRKKFLPEWGTLESFNENIIYNSIASGENVCSIDWDNISEYDSLNIIPDWKSIMVIPIKKAECVLAVLYLSVSHEVKEFNGDELNFVSTLGKIITTIL
ncbi:diguanylate cyclase [Clostridium sp.]|uniref:diguanylate cyclase n=1 Tax=Clostridium sp. TaxID=1506 RepID=UPI002FCA08F4